MKKMCLGQFYLEKNQKIHRETASGMAGFFAVEPKQPGKNVARSYKGKYARSGNAALKKVRVCLDRKVPQVSCAQKAQQLASLVI